VSIDYAELRHLAAKGKRAEGRSAAAMGCLAVLIGLVLNAAWHGWMLMIAVGALHGGWLHGVPTIGYWTSVFFMFGIRAATFGMFSKSATKES
jgi:hypothetical protein